jgi:F-type H+-transporting ATPase subunit b
MLIDWFTVGAQVLNFIILVWLMKRFLYRPIINAVDQREKRIKAELASADKDKADAKQLSDEFTRKNELLDQQRAALLRKAEDEAGAERQRLLDEARHAADALSAKRLETLRSDARDLNQALARRAQEEVFAIARMALSDLAGMSLEGRLCEVFIGRLRELDGQAKTDLVDAMRTAPDPMLVRSAFDLPAQERTKIQNAINETFSADVPIRFETDSGVVSGIELTANGQKVAWSIAGYLTSLEEGVNELLRDKGAHEDDPEPGESAPEASSPETPLKEVQSQ